jgi:hypothetical protein
MKICPSCTKIFKEAPSAKGDKHLEEISLSQPCSWPQVSAQKDISVILKNRRLQRISDPPVSRDDTLFLFRHAKIV